MAWVSEKGVKQLLTESVYKSCFNKLLPANLLSLTELRESQPLQLSSCYLVKTAPSICTTSFFVASDCSSRPATFMALAFFVFIYTSRCDFRGTVKQLQANSSSSLSLRALYSHGWVFHAKSTAQNLTSAH